MLFWGSLRGGVALAVALSLPGTIPQRSLIVMMTFGVVLFTILVQGITVQPLGRKLRILSSAALAPRPSSLTADGAEAGSSETE